jgi:hypothetical protein
MNGDNTTASAAIIIKDDTADWKDKPVLAVHINDGTDIGAASAFTMEYLALAGALQATVLTEGRLHATGSDAKSVLDLLTGRRQRLQAVTKDHHYLLQCVDNSLHKGAPLPFHVRSHVERRKPARDRNGRLGATWSNHEWGNWIADRVAANDTAGITQQGIRYHMIAIPAGDMYAKLVYHGQWYIGNARGLPVKAKGVQEVIQSSLHKQYHKERDEYRLDR